MKRMLSLILLSLLAFPTAGKLFAAGTQDKAVLEPGKPVEFSIFIRSVPEFVPEGNPWTAKIDGDTNSKITWIASPYANAWEKRNVMLASGDYPDVIIMDPPNDAMYKDMVDAKKLLKLDPYLGSAKNLMAYTHQVSWDAVRDRDGAVYMIPRCTIIREDVWLNRLDWRKKLGIGELKTIEDWKLYAKAVADKDPDGNGKRDTFCVTDHNGLMTTTNTANLKDFAKCWNAGVEWYDNGKGELFFGMFHKDGRFKEALQFYKDLYAMGSLEPDFVSNKGGTIKHDKWRQSVVATNNTFAGAADTDLKTLRAVAPKAEIEFVKHPLTGMESRFVGEKMVLTQTGVYNAWGLTDKARGKEAHIVSVFDYLLSDTGWELLNYGVEDIQYKKVSGKIEVLQPEYGNFIKWQSWTMLLRRPMDKSFWLKNQIPEIYSLQEKQFNESINAIKTRYIEKGLAGFVSEKEKDFKKKDIWTTKLNELVMNIVVGNTPVSAWDTFINEVYAQGWQGVVDEYNAFYASHK